ncbi:MAG: PASTA domain-containing protein [Rhodococcus sp. (in: high G+C Gram-positive bacteria)]
MAATLAACGSDEPATTAPTTTVTTAGATNAPGSSTTVRPVTTTPVVPPPAPAPEAQAAPTIVPMPNVVCMNLQSAQNAIQAAGVFFSRSEDATGAGRRQVLDSNWIVVGQTPPAGMPISEGDAVLSVVKIGEPNNC